MKRFPLKPISPSETKGAVLAHLLHGGRLEDKTIRWILYGLMAVLLYVAANILLIALDDLHPVPLGMALGLVGVSVWLYRSACARVERPEQIAKEKGVEAHDFHMAPLVRESPNELEREHMPLGVFEGYDRVPFLLHLDLPKGHALITGATGGGKTFKAFVAIVAEVAARKADHVLVIDCKGDEKLRRTARWLAKRNKRRFRILSNSLGRLTMQWNPFMDSIRKQITPEDLAAMFAKSAGLDFGPRYGAQHFLNDTIDVFTLTIRVGGPQSFREMLRLVTEGRFRKRAGISEHKYQHAGDGVTWLRLMASLPHLNQVTRLAKRRFDVGRMVSKPGLDYVEVAQRVNDGTAKGLGRLIEQFVIQAATLRGNRGPRVWLFEDEGNVLLQWGTTQTIIKQARDTRVSFVITMQNFGDAQTENYDARSDLEGNLALKISCSAKDQVGAERLERIGGKEWVENESHTRTEGDSASGRSVSRSTSKSKTLQPRITSDVIDELNADPELAIVEAAPHTGFTRLANNWAMIRLPWAIPTELFEKIIAKPIPKPDGVSTFFGKDLPKDDTGGGASAAPKPTPPTPPPPAAKKPIPPEPEDPVAKAFRARS